MDARTKTWEKAWREFYTDNPEAWKAKERYRNEIKRVREEEEMLIRLIEAWKYSCFVCKASGFDGSCNNRSLQLWHVEAAAETRVGVSRFREYVEEVDDWCCSQCLLPIRLCEHFERDVLEGEERRALGLACEIPEVLEKIWFSIWVQAPDETHDTVEKAMREDGWKGKTDQEQADGPEFEDMARWLCTTRTRGGYEGSMLCWMILGVVDMLRLLRQTDA
jgi:hypothetical protein